MIQDTGVAPPRNSKTTCYHNSSHGGLITAPRAPGEGRRCPLVWGKSGCGVKRLTASPAAIWSRLGPHSASPSCSPWNLHEVNGPGGQARSSACTAKIAQLRVVISNRGARFSCCQLRLRSIAKARRREGGWVAVLAPRRLDSVTQVLRLADEDFAAFTFDCERTLVDSMPASTGRGVAFQEHGAPFDFDRAFSHVEQRWPVEDPSRH